MSYKPNVPDLDEVWKLVRETQKNLKDVSAGQKELQAGQKELQASQKIAEKEGRELRAMMDRTDVRINRIVGDFGNRWGKLGENLVKGSLVQRLKERGIEVEKVMTNAKKGDLEFDIIAINGKELVLVEVKATLDPSDVDEFTENIEKFKIHWPEFKGKTLYGAMAFLIRANKQAGDMAQKRGFFVIEATGDVIIQNKKDFEPKIFS